MIMAIIATTRIQRKKRVVATAAGAEPGEVKGLRQHRSCHCWR